MNCLVESHLTVTPEKIRHYAALTCDTNPIHLDPEFAAASPVGAIVAHGTLSLSLIWQSLQQTFPNERVATAELDIRFVNPAYQNDRLTVNGRLKSDNSKIAECDSRCKNKQAYSVVVVNQNEDVIIDGTINV